MRLALSCTAEYSNVFGATSSADVALVVAAAPALPSVLARRPGPGRELAHAVSH